MAKVKYKKSPEQARAQSYKWRRNNREKFLASARNSNLKGSYGITEADYQRMLVEQESHCKACSRTPAQEFHKRLCVDHNHVTGEVRCLLCTRCNSILGYCYENPQTLRNLLNVLAENG